MMHEETSQFRPETPSASNAPQSIPIATADSEIDLKALVRLLSSRRGGIIKSALISACMAAIVLIFVKPTYTAKASFLPPNSMSSGSSAILSQLGALGGAGASLGGLKDPSLVYIGILQSRTIADDLIRKFDLAKVYKTKKMSKTEKALAAHSSFLSGKDTIISISVEDHDPQRAADIANGYLSELHIQNDRISFTEAGQRRIFFEEQLKKEKDALADAEVDLARSQEQTGLIQPSGQARIQLETIAQTQAEIASREIQLAAMSQSATDLNPDIIRIRSEIAGLRSQLNKLEDSRGSRGAGDIQLPTAKVPELTLIYVRKAREVKYHEALYELLLKQYESAKLDESRSAPLMQVVDTAVVPDTKSGPQRMLIIFLATIVGGCFGIVRVIAQAGVKSFLIDVHS